MPEWLLWLGGIVVALIGWLIGRWAVHVERHIEEARHGYERIAKLETKLGAHLKWYHGLDDDDDGEA